MTWRGIVRCGPGWGGTLALSLSAATPSGGYRFYVASSELVPIASAAEAVRWRADDFPLRFHLQDNIPEFLDEARWREIVRAALGEWIGVRTAEVSLLLEPGLVPGAGADQSDERLTIGWVSETELLGALGYATVSWFPSSRRFAHCDITMNRDRFEERLEDGIEPDAIERTVARVLVHEFGHCLGLRHTEPHPIPGWLAGLEDSLPIPAGFRPETVMSYGRARAPGLAGDDVTGVSLLYPAFGFRESRGGIPGRLTREAAPVSFAYVQAVYPGARPRMGPGVFADAEGAFHLEGLEPGRVLLWVHPILVHYSNAHGDLLGLASEGGGLNLVDQWQWVVVEPGQTIGIPDLELSDGRFP